MHKIDCNLKFISINLLHRKAIKQGKEEHDRAYMKDLIWHEIWPNTRPMTNEKPYYPNVITQPQEDDLKIKTKVFEDSSGHNLLKENTDWAGLDLQIRMTYFLRRKKQKLCAGTVRYLNFFF